MSGNITSGSISKIAREFNGLKPDETILRIRMASNLNKSINMAMQEQIRNQDRQEETVTPVVTAEEVRKAYEDGEYR